MTNEDKVKISEQALAIVQGSESPLALRLYERIKQGKMLRSRLILSVVRHDLAYVLCAIVELIQTASLLHDDVIDESRLRRGRPSLNAEFGNKSAIMLGDILYASAFCELAKFHPLIARNLSLGVAKLSVGELEDVSLEEGFNSREDLYLSMIEHKSASLIASSAFCASILRDCLSLDSKNPNKAQIDSIAMDRARLHYDYGLNLGLAFQIIDDILDITQDSATLGKPAMSDFRCGKTTLPYIYLYEVLDDSKKPWLLSLFGRATASDDGEELGHLLKELSLDRTRKKALHYAELARSLALRLDNVSLGAFVDSVLQRDC